jgi:hypothetical protein
MCAASLSASPVTSPCASPAAPACPSPAHTAAVGRSWLRSCPGGSIWPHEGGGATSRHSGSPADPVGPPFRSRALSTCPGPGLQHAQRHAAGKQPGAPPLGVAIVLRPHVVRPIGDIARSQACTAMEARHRALRRRLRKSTWRCTPRLTDSTRAAGRHAEPGSSSAAATRLATHEAGSPFFSPFGRAAERTREAPPPTKTRLTRRTDHKTRSKRARLSSSHPRPCSTARRRWPTRRSALAGGPAAAACLRVGPHTSSRLRPPPPLSAQPCNTP